MARNVKPEEMLKTPLYLSLVKRTKESPNVILFNLCVISTHQNLKVACNDIDEACVWDTNPRELADWCNKMNNQFYEAGYDED